MTWAGESRDRDCEGAGMGKLGFMKGNILYNYPPIIIWQLFSCMLLRLFPYTAQKVIQREGTVSAGGVCCTS